MSHAIILIVIAAAAAPCAAMAEAGGCVDQSCTAQDVMLIQRRPGTLSPAKRGSPLQAGLVAAALMQQSADTTKHEARSAQDTGNPSVGVTSVIDTQKTGQPQESDEGKYDYNHRRNGSAEQLPEADAKSRIDRLEANITKDRELTVATTAKLNGKTVEEQAASDTEKVPEARSQKADTEKHTPSHGLLVIVGVCIVLVLSCGIAALWYMSQAEDGSAAPGKKTVSEKPPAPTPAPTAAPAAENAPKQEEDAATKQAEEDAAAKRAEEEAAAKKQAEEEAAAKKQAEEEAAAKKRAEEEEAARHAEEAAAAAAADKRAEEDAAAATHTEEEVALKHAEEHEVEEKDDAAKALSAEGEKPEEEEEPEADESKGRQF